MDNQLLQMKMGREMFGLSTSGRLTSQTGRVKIQKMTTTLPAHHIPFPVYPL